MLVLQIELRTWYVYDDGRLFGLGFIREGSAVEGRERLLNLRLQRDHRLHFAAGSEAQIVEGLEVAWVRCGDHER